ncbi:hypothetical protein [uncultured Treponema sp.]|uniref:hypothetical protein n=1 Tax=uncultured Treponema sp. TaxID=162155 RepID=UPI002805B794|nr:hypothetical protein [uncultured Treponema sp.]
MRRILFFVMASFFVLGCVSTKSKETPLIPVRAELIEANPPLRPEWADSIPHSDDVLYFVGLSNGVSTEKEARSDAYQNVLSQVIKYYGELIKSQATESKSVKALSSDIVDSYVESEELIQRYAEAYVHEILPENYYTEHWIAGEKNEWRCWIKCSVSKQKIQKEIDTFAGTISERYSSLLPENQRNKYTSTKSAVQGYLDVYKAVHKNPIYQAVAYVQTSSGKASLDDYAILQAKRIIQNINIKDIDYNNKIEYGSQLNVIIHLDSPDYEKITGMSAIAALNHNGKEIAVFPFSVNDKNDIEFQIKSEKLEYGDYLVAIKLFTDAFKELGTVYTSTTAIAFSFGYIQAPVKIEYIRNNATTQINDLRNEAASKVENFLQDKLTEYEIPIEIAKESSSNSQFLMQIKSIELKAAENVQKIKLTATILFQLDGVALAKSSEVSAIGLSKTNMAAENALEQICEQLKKDESFYKNLLKSVGEKRK